MVICSKKVLGVERLDVLADKGYYKAMRLLSNLRAA